MRALCRGPALGWWVGGGASPCPALRQRGGQTDVRCSGGAQVLLNHSAQHSPARYTLQVQVGSGQHTNTHTHTSTRPLETIASRATSIRGSSAREGKKHLMNDTSSHTHVRSDARLPSSCPPPPSLRLAPLLSTELFPEPHSRIPSCPVHCTSHPSLDASRTVVASPQHTNASTTETQTHHRFNSADRRACPSLDMVKRRMCGPEFL